MGRLTRGNGVDPGNGAIAIECLDQYVLKVVSFEDMEEIGTFFEGWPCRKGRYRGHVKIMYFGNADSMKQPLEIQEYVLWAIANVQICQQRVISGSEAGVAGRNTVIRPNTVKDPMKQTTIFLTSTDQAYSWRLPRSVEMLAARLAHVNTMLYVAK